MLSSVGGNPERLRQKCRTETAAANVGSRRNARSYWKKSRTTCVKSKQFHLERDRMQGTLLSTPLFQLTPATHHDTAVGNVEQGTTTESGLSNTTVTGTSLKISVADDTLLFSWSLEHTTTMQDDLTTTTEAHERHTACNDTPRKQKSIPPRHQKQERRHVGSSRDEFRGPTTRLENSSPSKTQSKSCSTMA